MDFQLPEELVMIQGLVRDFVTDQLKPLERAILGRATDLSDAQLYLAPDREQDLIGMAKDIGLWGLAVPDELGGTGLNVLGNCLVEEALAQTIVPFSFGDVPPMLFDCNAKQREEYLTPALNREKYPYVALMEPESAGLENLETTGERIDGHYVLDGSKVSFSRTGEDYFAIVFAVTEPVRGAREGVTCFLVDKGNPGLTVRGGEREEGWQARVRKPLFLTLEDCRVPPEGMLGEEGRAFSLAKTWLVPRRIIRSARCVGAAQRLLDECTTQANNWAAFGQVISGRPSVQAALADIATNIHAARLLVYEAAWKADKGQPTKRASAMVKLFATQMMNFVCDNAAHIFNAPAYVEGLPMERFCHNAAAMDAAELALQLQRNIIGRDLLDGVSIS